MRLPLPIPLALGAALAWAGGAGAQETYRCPNNDYKNTISAKEAEKLGCKKLEGAPVTVIQMTKPRPAGTTAVPAATGSSPARVDPAAQRSRDSDARRILEGELRTEEERLAALKKEYNNGRTYYGLQGTMLHRPSRNDDRPDEALLEWHRDRLFKP